MDSIRYTRHTPIPVTVKRADRITISLPGALSHQIRVYAAHHHRGKFSTAIAELAAIGLRERVTKSGVELPTEATSADST